MSEREKVTIARVEYGPTASDVKVILSDGRELDGLTAVDPKNVTPNDLCSVTITAILKGAEK